MKWFSGKLRDVEDRGTFCLQDNFQNRIRKSGYAHLKQTSIVLISPGRNFGTLIGCFCKMKQCMVEKPIERIMAHISQIKILRLFTAIDRSIYGIHRASECLPDETVFEYSNSWNVTAGKTETAKWNKSNFSISSNVFSTYGKFADHVNDANNFVVSSRHCVEISHGG